MPICDPTISWKILIKGHLNHRLRETATVAQTVLLTSDHGVRVTTLPLLHPKHRHTRTYNISQNDIPSASFGHKGKCPYQQYVLTFYGLIPVLITMEGMKKYKQGPLAQRSLERQDLITVKQRRNTAGEHTVDC